jgi:hypothetical protein
VRCRVDETRLLGTGAGVISVTTSAVAPPSAWTCRELR